MTFECDEENVNKKHTNLQAFFHVITLSLLGKI